MKKILFILTLALSGVLTLHAGLKPGDKAVDFALKNVDGATVSLSDYHSMEGVILVFTCNTCPYAQAYEKRIIDLHRKYASEGFPVLAVNPNDDEVQPADTWAKMKERAKDQGYPFPYLKDESQEVYRAY